MECTVGIGLLGCGTVGAAVAERLVAERDAIARRTGVAYRLRTIAIADAHKRRPPSLDPACFTTDARSAIDDPRNDVIVELVGGTGHAGEYVEYALDRGRHVVTANKDLIATAGPRLRALALARRAALRFEGAVAGAIPVARVLDEALAGDRIRSIAGIVNGTCNFILSAMEEGAGFSEALELARASGYAEADAASDVDGIDAAHKLALLVQLGFRLAVISPRIRRTGIGGVSRTDVARAAQLGYRIRHLAVASYHHDRLLADVGPVLVPLDHEFARTHGADNAMRIDARDAGTLFLHGRGAGGDATASAVLGDVVSTLRAIAERHDFTPRSRDNALDPAIDVAPLLQTLARSTHLPQYPLWDDSSLLAPATPAFAALSRPGKARLA